MARLSHPSLEHILDKVTGIIDGKLISLQVQQHEKYRKLSFTITSSYYSFLNSIHQHLHFYHHHNSKQKIRSQCSHDSLLGQKR